MLMSVDFIIMEPNNHNGDDVTVHPLCVLFFALAKSFYVEGTENDHEC